MTTALAALGSAPHGADLVSDLEAVGIRVLGSCSGDALVREAARLEPDVIVWHEAAADDALFAACELLAEVLPRPVVVFTGDPDAEQIDRAMRAGIHAWVVGGYDTKRLRAVVQVARSRFAHEATLREALADVSRRFDERKLVDRAKGILMRARQLSEDEAFSVLRAASMHTNRRVGQVSRQVIAAAHDADAVNRAGKLRMLSQRLVKQAAMAVAEPAVAAHAVRLTETVATIDAHLETLEKRLSRPTFGDLLDAVSEAWQRLRTLASSAGRPGADRLPELDAFAERLLREADRLVEQLEAARLVTTLSILNVAGRQRMRSQRVAKAALLATLLSGAVAERARAALATTAAELAVSTERLRALPLTTPEIRTLLDAADTGWAALDRNTRSFARTGDVRALDMASDTLLDVFEQLADRYERSMHVLMG